jgi:hypothetical protein
MAMHRGSWRTLYCRSTLAANASVFVGTLALGHRPVWQLQRAGSSCVADELNVAELADRTESAEQLPTA